MPKPEFSVSVAVRHLPEQSDPQSGQHAFAYTVTIRNSGDVTAQLIARRWIITDATGHTEEVRGLAVVGNQPLLKPGETFEYTSWTRLATAHGTMRGMDFDSWCVAGCASECVSGRASDAIRAAFLDTFQQPRRF